MQNLILGALFALITQVACAVAVIAFLDRQPRKYAADDETLRHLVA